MSLPHLLLQTEVCEWRRRLVSTELSPPCSSSCSGPMKRLGRGCEMVLGLGQSCWAPDKQPCVDGNSPVVAGWARAGFDGPL